MAEAIREEDLYYKGRASNRELKNFRLWGKSKHQQYFTPLELSEVIFSMLKPAIADHQMQYITVLDPTCGSGRLLLPWKKAGAQVLGIELDKDVAEVAKRLLGKEQVRVGDILDYALHLENFNIAVCNPPYGIYWQIEEKGLDFDCASYGGSIESQSAVIEIVTNALSYQGIMVSIIPSSTFANLKDKKLRDYIFDNYVLLLRASLKNVFKEEYGIDVEVDLIIG